jgi:hypothetical protein
MFKTLDDLKKEQKGEKKDKKQTSSYAGGENRYLLLLKLHYFPNSGLAIENPEDKKNVQEILSKAEK